MANPINAIVPGLFESAACSFVNGNGTAARVVVEPQPGAAATGNLPAFYGGFSLLDLIASSTESSSSRDVQLWLAEVLTTQDATNTGAMVTTTSTIPRASGSFIADGWRLGDLVMTFAPPGTAPNAAMDGILGIVTTAAAGTLTVNGTPFAALTLAAGTRVCRVSPLMRAPVAAGSGTNGTTAAVSLLNGALDGSIVAGERKFGPSDMLVAGMQSAVTAGATYVALVAQYARY